MGYEDDLAIDKNNLDEECVYDSGIYDNWSRVETEAKQALEKAKDRLKVVEAEVDFEIRRKGKAALEEEYGLNSVTDKAITSLVILSPKVRQAKEDYLSALHKANIAETARRSFDKRGSRIDNLVFLHGQGYYGRGKGSLKKVAVDTLKKKYGEALEEAGLADSGDLPAQPEIPREKPTKTKKTKTKKEERENG